MKTKNKGWTKAIKEEIKMAEISIIKINRFESFRREIWFLHKL